MNILEKYGPAPLHECGVNQEDVKEALFELVYGKNKEKSKEAFFFLRAVYNTYDSDVYWLLIPNSLDFRNRLINKVLEYEEKYSTPSQQKHLSSLLKGSA